LKIKREGGEISEGEFRELRAYKPYMLGSLGLLGSLSLLGLPSSPSSPSPLSSPSSLSSQRSALRQRRKTNLSVACATPPLT